MKNFFLCSSLIFIFSLSNAQPFTLDPAIKPVELKLQPFNPKQKEREKEKGRINVTKVTQVKDTLYYFVQGASIFSPVYVGVTTSDPANKINVQLSKMTWNNVDRKGSTDDKGQWHETFKTENDFGIMVVPDAKPAKYTLMVWVGNEAKIELPSVLNNSKKDSKDISKEGEKNGSSSMLLYVVIGILVALVAFLFFKLKNKKS